MKAIIIEKNRYLTWGDVPDPQLKNDEVLIEVHAAGVNRADLMQRAGDYPPPPDCPEWMGLEVSGTITAMGPEAAKHHSIGDKVCALLGSGGYAQYAAVRYDMCMPIPAGVSMVEAAAIPEAFAASYLNLFIEGEAKPGETLLMHAGASGLASVLIPMARAFGLRVLTSVRTDDEAKSISHLQADRIIVTSREDVSEVLRQDLETKQGIDLVIDCLGGDMAGSAIPYMNRGGRWIIIATLAGNYTQVDLRQLYTRSLRLSGNTLRSRSLDEKAGILAAMVRDIWPLAEKREVLPTIYCTLPIERAEEAHMLLESGVSAGKVVLIVNR